MHSDSAPGVSREVSAVAPRPQRLRPPVWRVFASATTKIRRLRRCDAQIIDFRWGSLVFDIVSSRISLIGERRARHI